MEDFLSMDNILTGDEAASLFSELEEQVTGTPQEPENNVEPNLKETEITTEVDPETLFEDKEDKPESVGGEEIIEGKKDTTSELDGTSPENNFYSSIASALKEEGIFPDLDDSAINSVVEAEDFRDLVDKLIRAELDEAQRRILDALNSGVEPSIIKQYENTLSYLNNITEEMLNDETEKGETLRRQLLQQDFMNRHYSQERAIKMTEKLFASGEDIEEAKLALQSNKEFFDSKYQEILDKAKKEEEDNKKAAKKLAEQLKKTILSEDKIFGLVDIDKATRLKVYDNVAKPVYKDPETGEFLTALLKYRLEHENDFIKNVGVLFTLTDGFTNLDKLVTPSSKKEVKRQLKDLELKLKRNTSSSGGPMNIVGLSPAQNNKSFFDQGFTIDIG